MGMWDYVFVGGIEEVEAKQYPISKWNMRFVVIHKIPHLKNMQTTFSDY